MADAGHFHASVGSQNRGRDVPKRRIRILLLDSAALPQVADYDTPRSSCTDASASCWLTVTWNLFHDASRIKGRRRRKLTHALLALVNLCLADEARRLLGIAAQRVLHQSVFILLELAAITPASPTQFVLTLRLAAGRRSLRHATEEQAAQHEIGYRAAGNPRTIGSIGDWRPQYCNHVRQGSKI